MINDALWKIITLPRNERLIVMNEVIAYKNWKWVARLIVSTKYNTLLRMKLNRALLYRIATDLKLLV